MKRIIALTCIVFLLNPLQAQRSARYYEEAWKKVDRFDAANLPASAALEVSRIRLRANSNGNLGQELKAIFRYGSYVQENRKDATLEYVDSLTVFLREATGIRKALLHSMRASALSEYLSAQRWVLYGRSETSDRTDDIRTWSITDLHQQISADHLTAIKEREKLKVASPQDLAAALISGDLRKRRPTLYDLVVHAALDYFTRDERDIAKFSGGFEINDPASFAPAAEFTRHRFVTDDSLSLEVRALSLFQEAMAWHLNDRSPEALIDLDLRRLAFAHDRSVDPDKDQQYIRSLKELADRYASNPASAQASYLKANMDHRLAQETGGAASRDRLALQHIETACNTIIARFPGSEGALNAAILRETLRKPELNVQVEGMNIPGQDLRCRVNFRNVSSLHYRIIALSDSLVEVLSGITGNEYWKHIRSLPTLRTQSQMLPRMDDLRMHSLDLRIEALPAGRYLLLASPNPDFTPELYPLSSAGFHVTRIAWINRGNDYFVLDRETGAPLHDAKVRIWKSEQGYGERRTLFRLRDSARTDLNGHFLMPPPDLHAWGGQKLEVLWKGDRVFPDARDNAEWPDERPWISDQEAYEQTLQKIVPLHRPQHLSARTDRIFQGTTRQPGSGYPSAEDPDRMGTPAETFGCQWRRDRFRSAAHGNIREFSRELPPAGTRTDRDIPDIRRGTRQHQYPGRRV